MGEKGVLLIGPSNGWLFAQKIYDLPTHQKFLKDAGANAVELVMALGEEGRQKTLLSGNMDADFISVHLDDYYREKDMDEQVSLAKNIFDRHKASAAVAHPVTNPESYYMKLIDAGVPAAIENMDKNKPCGYTKWEIWHLIEKFGLKFVLDVQHAYEHDSGMLYAWDLFQMTDPILVYLHVSGQSKRTIHSLVHLADNKTAIINFLGKILSKKKLPIILEGQYSAAPEVKTEIEFLKQELGF